MPQTYDQFVDRYGGIYENSTWVAEETYAAAADVSDAGQLANIFASCVDEAAHDRKLTLIRAHPDLAGKAAIAGDLTEESNDEQSSAGIDRCTSEEYAQFQLLNAQYLEKFDFPFVMAVRNSNRGDILRTFAQRLKNGDKTEFATAIAEIHKIARLRLAVMDKP
ncbi:MAG: 2-oxo-4-hydroxy-4-carboxy-5-ureidoimidazoline decarboxylase [Proteobacteria bacterium]|nr:2-oxo-4-hydroxy-4-carboxy-5-ureidoimidazoline decarboxylase [Pseudomonadota bacterium]